MNTNRILGERTGSVHGPLMIVFAQIHGNEPAGYLAVRELFNAIDEEYIQKHYFDFKGKILALQGNMKAAQKGVRFLEKDLNRSWLPENVERIFAAEDESELDPEDLEIKGNLEIIYDYIENYKPTRVVVLDLHTTTAHGGIFTIPATDPESRRIALNLHAPVLHGFLDGLRGTTLHYFKKENFPGIDMTAVCFEAGQHEDSVSHMNAVSAIINCFRTIGGFYEEDIEIRHDLLLQRHANGLPREAKLVHVHRIKEGEEFRMRRDKTYQNFDRIEKDELLALNINGEILSPYTGLILMPLYQQQGDDGFFIIQEVTNNAPMIVPSKGLAASK
ncbi:MAG: succinylglutamate desuccinylase [Aureispira sp.]|nr:succinylglutamate desuccinylase [Aureispira sp.]